MKNLSTLFPDCEINDIPQHLEDGRTNPDWLELRKGNLTASKAGLWLLEGKKVRTTIDEAKSILETLGIEFKKSGQKAEYYLSLLPDAHKIPTYSKEAEGAKETAICDILEDMASDPTKSEPYPSRAMQRGTDLEPLAARAFSERTGLELEHVGFCQSIHGSFGASPDGLIKGESIGLEIKCLENHVRCLRAGVIPKEYFMQVQLSMAVTGAKAWHFFAWSPVLPPLHLLIERDDTTERLLTSLVEFSADLEAAKDDMAQRWAEEQRQYEGRS